MVILKKNYYGNLGYWLLGARWYFLFGLAGGGVTWSISHLQSTVCTPYFVSPCLHFFLLRSVFLYWSWNNNWLQTFKSFFDARTCRKTAHPQSVERWWHSCKEKGSWLWLKSMLQSILYCQQTVWLNGVEVSISVRKSTFHFMAFFWGLLDYTQLQLNYEFSLKTLSHLPSEQTALLLVCSTWSPATAR